MKNIIFSIFKVFLILVFFTGCEVAITPLEDGGANPVVSISTPEGTNEIDDENGVTIIEIANTPGQISLGDIRVELRGIGSENFETSVELVGDTFVINAAPKEGFSVIVTTTFTLFATVYINESPSCEKEIIITLHGITNQPMISGTPTLTVNEDTFYSFIPTATDVDVNDTLTFSVVNLASWADFNTSTGELSGTPSNADVGITTGIEISVTDGLATATLPAFDIEVLNVNNAPIASDINVSLSENSTVDFNLSATDLDGDPLSYTILTAPLHGTVTLSGTEVHYVPDANYTGTDSMVYEVADASTSDTGIVIFSITVQNDAPMISGTPTLTVNEDTFYSFIPTATDVDVNDTLTFSVVNLASWADFNTSTGELSGTPSNADVGITTGIEISVTDGLATATLPAFDIEVLNVNNAPIASDINVSLSENSTVDFNLSATDLDGDPLSYTILTAPLHGTVTLSGTEVHYVPDANYTGTDSMVYEVADASTSDTGIVIFSITVQNDAPMISGTPTLTVNEDTFYSFIPTATDVDVNDTLTFSVVNLASWADFNTSTGELSGTPSNADVGITTGIEISVTDGLATATLPAFDIEVLNVNNAPIASDINVSLSENSTVDFNLSATDLDGDPLSYTILTAPLHGTVTLSGTEVHYVPDANYTGTDSMVYEVADASTSDTGIVIFSITVQNDAPMISGTPTLTVNEDTFYSFIPTATDVDVNDTLTFSVVNLASWADFNTSTGELSGTPSNADVGITTGIEISVTDGLATATLPAFDIEVLNVNNAPIASDINVSLSENSTVDFNLSATDLDGDPLSYTILTAPLHGTVTLSGTEVHYVPDANYTGTDSFTFVVNDGMDDSLEALVSILVESSPLSSSHLFSWCDDSNGIELWETDGTTGNTAILKNISITGDSNPELFVKVNGTHFFSAYSESNGTELWKSNSTTGSTVLVKDINPGDQNTSVYGLTDVNGTLFFVADDGVNGFELWKSDGTEAGTVMVKDINSGNPSSYPFGLTVLNGTLFFVADDGINGDEVWKSDGTESGTVLVADMTAGGSSIFADIGTVNGLLMVSALDFGTLEFELFSVDNNDTVTQIGDFPASITGQHSFVTINNTLYFSGYDLSDRRELWKSDGVTTDIVKDINTDFDSGDPLVGNSNPIDLIDVNGTLYFTAIEKDGWDRELWQSDGTEAGTTWVTPATKNVSQLTSANGKLYFIATTNTSKKFYHVDESGASALFQFKISDGTTDIIDLREDKGMIYFRVLKDVTPDELWVYDTGVDTHYQLATGCTL